MYLLSSFTESEVFVLAESVVNCEQTRHNPVSAFLLCTLPRSPPEFLIFIFESDHLYEVLVIPVTVPTPEL